MSQPHTMVSTSPGHARIWHRTIRGVSRAPNATHQREHMRELFFTAWQPSGQSKPSMQTHIYIYRVYQTVKQMCISKAYVQTQPNATNIFLQCSQQRPQYKRNQPAERSTHLFLDQYNQENQTNLAEKHYRNNAHRLKHIKHSTTSDPSQ
jgi:hypothetical protein